MNERIMKWFHWWIVCWPKKGHLGACFRYLPYFIISNEPNHSEKRALCKLSLLSSTANLPLLFERFLITKVPGCQWMIEILKKTSSRKGNLKVLRFQTQPGIHLVWWIKVFLLALIKYVYQNLQEGSVYCQQDCKVKRHKGHKLANMSISWHWDSGRKYPSPLLKVKWKLLALYLGKWREKKWSM